MGANCTNCANTCQKGDKNEIQNSLNSGNHLASEEHLRRVILSQPNSPQSQSKKKIPMESKFQFKPQMEERAVDRQQDHSTKKQLSVLKSMALDQNQKDEATGVLCIQKYWRGYNARRYVKTQMQKPTPFPKKEEGNSQKSQETMGGKEANYFRQKDNELLDEKEAPVGKRYFKALYTFKSGATYQGEWMNNRRDGFGVQIWPDGAKYEGNWVDNRAEGQGVFYHIDGDRYVGSWKDDRANGYGVYEQYNGAKYEGHWKNDYQHGRGKEQWIDNSWYEGDYIDGRKEGKGKYVWPDGSYYEGEWRENKINGHGEYYWIDGRSYKGQWRNNNMHGKGIYKWQDGRVYEGEYINDKKQGFGKYSWADGRYYEGEWLDGKQHGRGKYVLANGNSRNGLWDGGKRVRWLAPDEITSNKQQ